jgi:transposase-like protein
MQSTTQSLYCPYCGKSTLDKYPTMTNAYRCSHCSKSCVFKDAVIRLRPEVKETSEKK